MTSKILCRCVLVAAQGEPTTHVRLQARTYWHPYFFGSALSSKINRFLMVSNGGAVFKQGNHFMPTTVVFAQIKSAEVDSPEFSQVTVNVDAKIISERRARRLANGWLLWNIGERIAVGVPELILEKKLVWRFPLHWTSSKQGVLADLVAELWLDALSGEVLETDTKIEEIHQRVQRVARPLQVTGG